MLSKIIPIHINVRTPLAFINFRKCQVKFIVKSCAENCKAKLKTMLNTWKAFLVKNG